MSNITQHTDIEDLHSLIKLRTRVHTMVFVETDGTLTACTAKSAKAKNMFKRQFLGLAGVYTAKIQLNELIEDIEAVKEILQII